MVPTGLKWCTKISLYLVSPVHLNPSMSIVSKFKFSIEKSFPLLRMHTTYIATFIQYSNSICSNLNMIMSWPPPSLHLQSYSQASLGQKKCHLVQHHQYQQLKESIQEWRNTTPIGQSHALDKFIAVEKPTARPKDTASTATATPSPTAAPATIPAPPRPPTKSHFAFRHALLVIEIK